MFSFSLSILLNIIVDIHNNLNLFFSDVLKNLPCNEDTQAYIVSIFSKYRDTYFDLSKDNITLIYARAHYNRDFLGFQTVADYLFFINTLFPDNLDASSRNYYYDIGRLSYYSCYKLINRQWQLYEAMSDNFILFSEEARKNLCKF
jgi:hypothetical protein